MNSSTGKPAQKGHTSAPTPKQQPPPKADSNNNSLKEQAQPPPQPRKGGLTSQPQVEEPQQDSLKTGGLAQAIKRKSMLAAQPNNRQRS